MNISFDGMFALAYSSARDLDHIEVGDHDPQQRGFNARNLEIALDGAVDPYFEGFANIVLKLDNDNETEIEVEEAFMQTTSLPWGLQIQGRAIFRRFRPDQSDSSAHLGFRGAPLVHGLLSRPGRIARRRRADFLDVAGAVVFAVALRRCKTDAAAPAFSFRNPGDDGIFFGRETTDREARGLRRFCLGAALGEFVRPERRHRPCWRDLGRLRFERDRRELAHADLRRRSSLQMEKRRAPKAAFRS